jgi:hypothetical protein
MRIAISMLVTILLFLATAGISAHPGSGLVTDRSGNVYFVDTGSGVWKIDRTGKLTRLSPLGYHWMAIDIDGKLNNVQLPHFQSDDATVTCVGKNPLLLLSSDFPVSVGPDGCLYYPWVATGDRVQIYRLSPGGQTTVVKTLFPLRSANGEIRWRNGLTVSSDGSIYFSEDRAIRKITPKGDLVTIIENFSSRGCAPVEGIESELGPYFRGMAVDSTGTVYVAAAGCRSILKVTFDGKAETILESSAPWSPTSVALSGSDLLVLEYTHTPGDNRKEWIPRIRKISSDGIVTTIATIKR